MNKTGSNPFLKIYIIICVVCFLLTVIVFASFLGWEYDSKILEIITIVWSIFPYSLIEILSMLSIADSPGIWSSIIFLLMVLLLWPVFIINVLLSTKSPKPWHIPAVVLLSIDTIVKFIGLLSFLNWHFFIMDIAGLLLNGLFFFLIWKIRKHAIGDEPEQIPQKYADTDFREI